MSALDFPTSPNDGDTYEGYVYNAAKGVWQWQTLTPSLVSLTDTTITSPANGEVLEYDGTNWVNAAAAAGGKILQIVRAADSTNRSTTSASFADVTGMSVTITPQKSTSKIILICSLQTQVFRLVTNGDERGQVTITDSSNNNISGGKALIGRTSDAFQIYNYLTMTAFDSPATTSATTYKLRFRVIDGGNASLVLINGETDGQMYAIEVAA